MEWPGTIVPEEGLALDDLEHRRLFLLTDQQSTRPPGQQRGGAHGCAAVDCQPIGDGHMDVSSGYVARCLRQQDCDSCPNRRMRRAKGFAIGAVPCRWRTSAAGR